MDGEHTCNLCTEYTYSPTIFTFSMNRPLNTSQLIKVSYLFEFLFEDTQPSPSTEARKQPTILYYGDSHLTRFKCWINTDEEFGGPKELDREVLQHRHFCAVGGSTFKNVHDRVRNINVPPTQPYRGNLWRYTLRVKELKPDCSDQSWI